MHPADISTTSPALARGRFALWWSLLLFLVSPVAFAGPPVVSVVDLDLSQDLGLSAGFRDGAYWNGLFIFSASLEDGLEPFVSDGTTEGTMRLLDIAPGEASSVPGSFVTVGGAENASGRVFFLAVAEDQAGLDTVYDLWITNGETGGTARVADFAPMGTPLSEPASLSAWDGDLYLTVVDDSQRKLLRLDPILLTGTLLGDGVITLEDDVEMLSTPDDLYFPVNDGGDWDLWSTDGSAVTQRTTTACESIQDLHVAGGMVFFACLRNTTTDVLVVDALGTDHVTTIHSYFPQGTVKNMTSAGGTLYWTLGDGDLWAYDPDAVGGPAVVELLATSHPMGGFARINGKLVIHAKDATYGREPRVVDGTSISLLANLELGDGDSLATNSSMVTYGDYVYFSIDTSTGGEALWRTDGTGGGTGFVVDGVVSHPANLRATSLGLFFSPDGPGLWVTDGTALGTRRVDDLQRTSSSFSRTFFDPLSRRAFFSARAGEQGTEPFVTNGTVAGTEQLGDLRTGLLSSNPEFLGSLPNPDDPLLPPIVLFGADDGVAGEQLWRSDGTELGTELVATINSTGSASINLPGVVLGSHLYFRADDGLDSEGLWRTDGTSAGTQKVDAVGATGVPSSDFAVLDGYLYYTARDASLGIELFRTNGVDPPALFVDLHPDDAAPAYFSLADGYLYFAAEYRTPGGGDETDLWRTDGTVAGTIPLIEWSGGESVPIGDSLLFERSDSDHGIEPWIATPSGATLLLDLYPGPTSSRPSVLGSVGGRAIFRADDGSGAGANQIWSTDGSGVTWLGAFTSVSSTYRASLDGWLYFRAATENEGAELWRTDGLVVEVIDIEPGPLGSEPRDPVGAGDRLYFHAYDSTFKRELRLLEQPLFADGFESGDTTAWQ